MKTVALLTAVVSVCMGAPQYSAPAPPPNRYSAPSGGSGGGSRSSGPVVAILRNDRIDHDGSGAHSFNMETANGISRTESGTSVQTAEGIGSAMQGEYSFTLPDGQVFTMSYVADENGMQVQSPFLPVAPAFPHPIPAHALEQIEFARQQRERGGTPDSGRYAAPPPAPSSSYRRPN